MAEAIIQDWLSDFNSLQDVELKSFAAQHENNHEISTALYNILNERIKYKELLYPVCNQLCNFYRSNEIELRRFTLQFLPVLIFMYLNSVAQGDKKSCRCVETLLICIYNIEVSADDGSAKIVSFRMPILAQNSIYHEITSSLQPIDLKRWEENSNKEIKWGPLPSVESVNAQNRLKVMTALLFTYNQQLSLIHKPALYHLCRTISQLVNQGFTKYGHSHRPSYGNEAISSSRPLPRIPVSSQFLVELCNAAYFAMFNEFASVAIEAVNDIHNRACFEMLPDVILVTNAVKNSLHANPSGQPSDGPMGISIALTPATTTVTISKSMVTNASFRTKKLPDDIPIQPREENSHLSSINEEAESSDNQSKSNPKPAKEKDEKKDLIKGHNVKELFVGLKKFKEKDKEKDAKNTKQNGAEELNRSSVTDGKSGPPSAKKMNSKDKIVVKTSSLQMNTLDGNDCEKSPLVVQKRKSTSVDIVVNHPTSNENGGLDGEEPRDDHIKNSSIDTGESFDSGNEIIITNNNTSKSAMDINKANGSMQVSQV